MIPLRVRRVMAWFLAGALLAAPLGIFLWNAHPGYFFFNGLFPPGQAVYIMMRPAGHIAFVLLFFQIVLGSHGPALARWLGCSSLTPLHRSLGMVTFAFVMLHPALFAWSRSLRAGKWEFPATFLPNPLENYWERMLFVGAIGLYLLCFAMVAALFRSWLGPRFWRWIHSLNYAAFLLAFWHAISIGSETRILPLHLFYWALALSSIVLLAIRVLALWSSPQTAAVVPENKPLVRQ